MDLDANLFRLLVESVKDYAIFVLDEHGIVRSWNAGAERIKQYRPDEIIGRHFSAFYPAEDVAAGKPNDLLRLALSEGRLEDFGWRVRKDGSQFWASVDISALRDASGLHIGFAKVTRDLTETSYRAFVEATNAIIWSTAPNGHPNADSPTWRAFTGQSVEDWRALRAWDAVHADDRPAGGESWEKARAERRTWEHEFRLLSPRRGYVWMASRAVPLTNADGTVREWFGVTTDVSARKSAELDREAALAREREARLLAERAESRWLTTLRSIGDAVVATDALGRVSFMNRVAEMLTQWSNDEARGRHLSEVFRIVNETTRAQVESPVDRVLREGVIVGLANHTLLVRRDGTDLPIDYSAAPIRDASGSISGVILVFRDVSAEKREEARQAFLARAGDVLGATSDYRDALETVAVLAVTRLADWCGIDIVEPGSKVPRQLAVAHVDPAKVKLARELGRRYPVDSEALTGVPNVLRTGTSELYPILLPELIERGARDPDHARLLAALDLRSAMVVPLRGRERVFGAMTFIYAESGRRYGVDDLAFAEELARRGAIAIERRMLEDEKARLLASERDARAEAEHANRAKDQFLAVVSHELRNPLNTILGWARILASRDLPAELAKPISAIERSANTQARLIEDVLDVSRIMSGKLRLALGAVDLDEIIVDTLESYRAAAEAKRVSIENEPLPHLEVYGDAVRLQQIVSNVVGNAVKFTHAGGTVRVRTREAGPHARLEVTDTGEGIEPHLLDTIFEPFQQADASTTRQHGGLGLGLAIVRQLVIAHGGSVRAESEGKGHGARFIIELPQLARSSARPGSVPLASAEKAPDLSGTHVLIVDDEPDALDVVGQILRDAGARVSRAGSAFEALAELSAGKPDIVVSDIGMPDVDGYGLMRAIRERSEAEGGRTPAIALTAFTRREDAERAATAGFQEHMPKPIDPHRLVRLVATLARHHRGGAPAP